MLQNEAMINKAIRLINFLITVYSSVFSLLSSNLRGAAFEIVAAFTFVTKVAVFSSFEIATSLTFVIKERLSLRSPPLYSPCPSRLLSKLRCSLRSPYSTFSVLRCGRISSRRGLNSRSAFSLRNSLNLPSNNWYLRNSHFQRTVEQGNFYRRL